MGVLSQKVWRAAPGRCADRGGRGRGGAGQGQGVGTNCCQAGWPGAGAWPRHSHSRRRATAASMTRPSRVWRLTSFAWRAAVRRARQHLGQRFQGVAQQLPRMRSCAAWRCRSRVRRASAGAAACACSPRAGGRRGPARAPPAGAVPRRRAGGPGRAAVPAAASGGIGPAVPASPRAPRRGGAAAASSTASSTGSPGWRSSAGLSVSSANTSQSRTGPAASASSPTSWRQRRAMPDGNAGAKVQASARRWRVATRGRARPPPRCGKHLQTLADGGEVRLGKSAKACGRILRSSRSGSERVRMGGGDTAAGCGGGVRRWKAPTGTNVIQCRRWGTAGSVGCGTLDGGGAARRQWRAG